MSVQNVGGVELQRSRSGWDIALGILLVIAGFVILGNAVVATAISVFFLGWMAVIGGIVALVASLFRIGKGGFWPALISGALLLVIGVVILRNPAASAVTLTLLAGTVFLVGGIMRLVAAFQVDQHRGIMIFSGLVSLALGLIVLFNLVSASFQLLGILIGVQAVVDGITLLILGRWRVVDTAVTATPISTS
jgi:uncharacterized membrane protein HdeD (DUF308 family)